MRKRRKRKREKIERNILLINFKINKIKTFKSFRNSKQLGIDTTRRFVAVNNYGYTRINKGDILELYYDDGSTCPIFNNLTTGKNNIYCFWHDLYYADDISLRDIINNGKYENI